jgi:hypothetical protein
MNDELKAKAVKTSINLAVSASLAKIDLQRMKEGARDLSNAELQLLYSGLVTIFCDAGTVIMDLVDELDPVNSSKAKADEVDYLNKLFGI